jgi:hypothetical protein
MMCSFSSPCSILAGSPNANQIPAKRGRNDGVFKLSQRKLIIFFILFLLTTSSFAHTPSSSYLFVDQKDQTLSLQWDIALRDLEHVIGLDSNLDANITWQEVQDQQQKMIAYAYSNLVLQRNNLPCELVDNGLQVNKHSDGMYVVLHIQPNCKAQQGALTLDYSLLFIDDPDHRGIVLDRRSGSSDAPYILSPDNHKIDLQEHRSLLKQFLTFVQEGVWHIWIGFDHILFIISLMLPAVLLYKDKQWRAETGIKPASLKLFKMVTAFTIAHSITLSLVTFELISLPSQWVEAVIALSVVFVALNNIKLVITHAQWGVAFLFGLIHGFGFASVLGDLNLGQGSLILSLLGFNIGVEIGQAAILLVLFPIAYQLRKSQLYQIYIFKGGSLLIAILAFIWFYERL